MKGIDVIVEQAGSHYQIAVVRVLGQIDTTTSHELERRLQYLLKDRQFEIVIDLSRVTYISSAGWGIFISEIRGIRENGGDLKLVGMTPEVAEVFELLEFHNILESFKTVEAAVEKFEKPKATPAAEKHASDKPVESASHTSERHESYESSGEAGSVPYGSTPVSQGISTAPNSTEGLVRGDNAVVQDDTSTGADLTGAAAQTSAFPTPSPDNQSGEPGAVSDGTGQTTRESVRAAREAQTEATSRVDSEYAAGSRHKTETMSPGAPGTVAEPEEPATMPMSKDLEAMILEIVREHPDHGCLKIRKELLEHDYRRPMNPLTLFMELKRLNLETKEKRKRYADSFAVVGSKK
jgi:anti-sigma B factor antagonist